MRVDIVSNDDENFNIVKDEKPPVEEIQSETTDPVIGEINEKPAVAYYGKRPVPFGNENGASLFDGTMWGTTKL